MGGQRARGIEENRVIFQLEGPKVFYLIDLANNEVQALESELANLKERVVEKVGDEENTSS